MNLWRIDRWALWLVLSLALTIVGCSTEPASPAQTVPSYVDFLTQEADDEFARVEGPRDFRFPADHGAHPAYRSEWWYFTGLVQSADGKQYGYQLTFFRFSLSNDADDRNRLHSTAYQRSGLLMGHFALTDATANSHVAFERFSRDGAGLAGVNSEREVRIWLEDWTASVGADGVWELAARAGTGPAAVAVDFRLQTATPPLLHGDRGYSRKGPEAGQANYYYSLVHLDTRGTLYVGGRAATVTGTSWMDHEWGTSALSAGSSGWDWFGLQLEDGTVLMAARIRTASGKPEPSFVNSLLTSEGRLHKLDQSQVQIEVGARWQSPRTGVVYPAAWELAVPSFELKCQVRPLVADQEFAGAAVYWEGAVSADCSLAGRSVAGQGYTELTGYDPAVPP